MPMTSLIQRTCLLNSLYSTGHRLSSTRAPKASDKLFADAAHEESEGASEGPPKSPTLNVLEQEHENWTGDERIQDAILRMLVDKYKPLRGPSMVTAEQKLKRAPPKVLLSSSPSSSPPEKSAVSGYTKPRSGSWANEPLLPSNEAHKPWETTFKTPSHDGPLNIKLASVPGSASTLGSGPGVGGMRGSGSLDERLVKKEKERMKKAQQVGRLSQALESTLDYRLGIKHSQGSTGKQNPVSVKGWNSFIEERIEKARMAGLFKNVKGRGQPLARSTDETNPCIAREEFLMNRIVQRNGAAPPWVEVQSELDTAVNTFRELLRQSWVRRALRILTTNNPAELLHKITLNEVKVLRDPDWVKKEQSYHETAIAELNSLVRKYNGLAPYTVRRPYYYTREGEIERMYEVSAEDVMRELRERFRDPGFIGNTGTSGSPDGTRGAVGGAGSRAADGAPVDQDHSPASWWRIRDLIREWIRKMKSSRLRQ